MQLLTVLEVRLQVVRTEEVVLSRRFSYHDKNRDVGEPAPGLEYT